MYRPKLSILIPTLARRRAYLARLMDVLRPQLTDDVEILTAEDSGEQTTGAKRNDLLKMASGRWVCGIDDDDLVPEDYVERTLLALAGNPDCVGWRMKRFTNGEEFADGIHSLSCKKYHVEMQPGGRRLYCRTPNHLNPIRTEIALATGFPDQTVAEDHCFAVRVFPHLKTEVFIDAVMYHYLYRTPMAREHGAVDAEVGQCHR